MDNVPVHVNNPTGSGRNLTDGASKKAAKQPRRKAKLASILAGVVVLLLLLGIGGWLYASSTAATIDSSKYQAVFFTNGQVYFGKLHQVNSNYLKLTDIFYIQSKDSKNPQATSGSQVSGSDLQLIKLGSEVHGPEDEMIISKDQVLFFENLKKDGTVSTSIDKYSSQKK